MTELNYYELLSVRKVIVDGEYLQNMLNPLGDFVAQLKVLLDVATLKALQFIDRDLLYNEGGLGEQIQSAAEDVEVLGKEIRIAVGLERNKNTFTRNQIHIFPEPYTGITAVIPPLK